MKVGIIGAGNVGSTLASRLTEVGHQVTVVNSKVSPESAVEGADLIVLAIPEKAVPSLPVELFVNIDVPVVDAGNYYPRQSDGLIEEIEADVPESVWVQKQIGHPVIKAFNNIFYKHLVSAARPAGADDRRALPIAGDDASAKAIVSEVIDQLGFDVVDAGSLDESWRQQPGTPVYGPDLDVDRVTQALTEASPQRRAEWRAE